MRRYIEIPRYKRTCESQISIFLFFFFFHSCEGGDSRSVCTVVAIGPIAQSLEVDE